MITSTPMVENIATPHVIEGGSGTRTVIDERLTPLVPRVKGGMRLRRMRHVVPTAGSPSRRVGCSRAAAAGDPFDVRRRRKKTHARPVKIERVSYCWGRWIPARIRGKGSRGILPRPPIHVYNKKYICREFERVLVARRAAPAKAGSPLTSPTPIHLRFMLRRGGVDRERPAFVRRHD